jgi:pyruvate dehydrogenase E2 component (dihydrolipoamide acetyltransferase)
MGSLMSELTKINIPDLGDVEEVEVIELCAEVGQTIDSEDPIMVLETDKAAMEIPASVSGVIKNIYISVGDMVSKGMPFIEVEVSISKDEVNSKDEVKEKANEVPDSKNSIKKEVLKEVVIATNSPINYKNSSIHSGPAVRKLAREFGINLVEVKGCGPKGRILKEDLHVFVSNRLSNKSQSGFQPSQPDIDYSKWGEVKLEKLSKFQKTAAKNLHTSWINIPHVTQHDDADITNLLLLRKDLNLAHKVKVSPLAFIIKATIETLKLFPTMNTSLTASMDSIVQKEYFNIGIAVDTPEGLIVPNIKDADKKSILQISDEVMTLATLAKERKLKVEQLKGASFTISSLSGIGGKYFTPIINPPEVGILGLSKTFDSLSLFNEKVISVKKMPVSLSYDHRVINGAYAAKFITEFLNQLNRIEFLKKSFHDS